MISTYSLLVPKRLPDICTPARCGVVIYDMQEGIVAQVPEGKAVLQRCQQLLAAARSNGFRVFFARHCFLPFNMAGVGQLRRSMLWQRQDDRSKLKPIMKQGSAEWQIVPELEPEGDEVIVDKISMSAFEGTFLNVAMRDAGLDAFLIAGIALEAGIEPTVRHALDLNYAPVLVADACGSRNAEVKQRSLETLVHTGEVLTVTTDEVITQCINRR